LPEVYRIMLIAGRGVAFLGRSPGVPPAALRRRGPAVLAELPRVPRRRGDPAPAHRLTAPGRDIRPLAQKLNDRGRRASRF